MKRKLDTMIIYLAFIIDCVSMALFMYSQQINSTHSITILEDRVIRNSQADFCYNLAAILYYSFYLLFILYVFFIFKKIKNKEHVDINKNSILLFILLFIDFILFSFNIRGMIEISFALRFIVLCLIVNLVLFIGIGD